MGFISFSLEYYSEALHDFESNIATPERIYLARQLLKILDDLLDEGYDTLYVKLEESCRGVSRLKRYLRQNNVEPFSNPNKSFTDTNLTYNKEEIELEVTIMDAVEKSKAINNRIENSFLDELIKFCHWIGYEDNTAYIFLLRDTMLPYVYYATKDRENLYPWLLGRKMLQKLTGDKDIDDVIRASIIRALEVEKCDNYDAFCNYVLPDIRKTLERYPTVETTIIGLLNRIKTENIIVVESGCYGTFPMLLKSLDNRIDMRMYTTVPFLNKIYQDRIYTNEYEKNRQFETLYSQDLYLRFSDFRQDCFYVNKCSNTKIQKNSLAEIKKFLF